MKISCKDLIEHDACREGLTLFVNLLNDKNLIKSNLPSLERLEKNGFLLETTDFEYTYDLQLMLILLYPKWIGWLWKYKILPQFGMDGEKFFKGADLSAADLGGANLRDTDLSGANLRVANLRWTNLSEANLSEANLRWADLRDTSLSGTNLRGADLSGANLRYSNLRGADLTGTKYDKDTILPEYLTVEYTGMVKID